jgi:hypothetical protein
MRGRGGGSGSGVLFVCFGAGHGGVHLSLMFVKFVQSHAHEFVLHAAVSKTCTPSFPRTSTS